MGDVVNKLLLPLADLLGPMPGETPSVIATYEVTLRRFPDDVLERDYAELAGTFVPSKRHPWPVPALCRRACEKVSPVAAPSGVADVFVRELRKRREQSRVWARQWLQHAEQGRVAVAEGWGHEAGIEAAQIHFAKAKDGREVAWSEVRLADASGVYYRRLRKLPVAS